MSQHKPPNKPVALRMMDDAVDIPRRDLDHDLFVRWKEKTVIDLGSVFGDDSNVVDDFKKIRWLPVVSVSAGGFGMSPAYDTSKQNAFNKGYERARAMLLALRERVKSWPDDARMTSHSPPSSPQPTAPTKIFIVHGHDGGLKNAVARFVQALGHDPIILHEQPNKGNTIIEKFEAHSMSAAFAIVLATADDLAANKVGVGIVERARQNVIFELGFFIGKLGRNRVALIKESKVELPSDLQGVIYLSETHWQSELYQELQATGLWAFTPAQIASALAIRI